MGLNPHTELQGFVGFLVLFLLLHLFLNVCLRELSTLIHSYLCFPIQSVQSLSCVQLFATPWIVAYQDPLSMGFSRQEYRNGLPFPSPGDPPDSEIKPASSAWQADSLPLSHQGDPQGLSTVLNKWRT